MSLFQCKTKTKPQACQNHYKVKPNRTFNKVVKSTMKNNNISLRNEVAKETPLYKNNKKQLCQSIDKPKEAPKTTNVITFDDSLYTKTADGRRFLLIDSNDDYRIICHATDSHLQCLSLSKIWHEDGTFKHAAEYYYQFFLIFNLRCFRFYLYNVITVSLRLFRQKFKVEK